MMGDRSLLTSARRTFGSAPAIVTSALVELEDVAERVVAANPGVEIRFDLSELSGYGYHNGPVFAAYQADQGAPVAQGGRYDGVGAHFGRARAATGFDMNLHRLLNEQPITDAVWVPWSARSDGGLLQRIKALRGEGCVVIQALGENETVPDRCVRELVRAGDDWVLRNRHG
jgi:ATP phosphoribosyltransferase regulatory subunit